MILPWKYHRRGDGMARNALRDGNKIPSIVVANADYTDTVAVRASGDGALMVSGGRVLKEVIKLDLGQSRDKELFDKSFNEITIPVIDGEFTLALDDKDGMTINRALSIETRADRFYISNGSGKGRVEIWLWE